MKMAIRTACVVCAMLCIVGCGKQPDRESVLRASVEQVNSLTPIEIDQITRLDSATYQLPATLRYHYTLALDSLSAVEQSDMIAYMRSTLPSKLRTEDGMVALGRLGIELQYCYGNPSGESLFEVTFAPEEYTPRE